MALSVVITGASGFLGQALLDTVTTKWPTAKVYPLHSPRAGGIDLAHPDAPDQLAATIHLSDPGETILIHAAAKIAWDSPDGLLDNAAMAIHVAAWAQTARIGFCVLVSTVSVYAPLTATDVQTPCKPTTMYGLGKWAAEEVWRLRVPEKRSAIVRLAGLWGWQRMSTLFWNRLLLAAGQGSAAAERSVVYRSRSVRNYISVHEASDCLLQVGTNRMSGLFLGAGRDPVTTGSFVQALQALSDSRLCVDWADDGGTDERLYHPSPELLPCLAPFPEVLSRVWSKQPDWVLQRS